MGRPATGYVRGKKDSWYASLPPAAGRGRDEVPFGAGVAAEANARRWLTAAMAAREAGAGVPDPRAFGAKRDLHGAQRPDAAVASTASAPGVPTAGPRPVRGLEKAYRPGRGHDLDCLFELWKPFYYRDLEAGGADREIAVEQQWTDYISPWLAAHARGNGLGEQYCVEELHRLVVAELRGHLKSHHDGEQPQVPEGPALVGEVTIREAVERYDIPKSTLARHVRNNVVPSHEGDDGVARVHLEDLRQQGLLGSDRPKRGRPRKTGRLAGDVVSNIMWVLHKVVEFAREMGVEVQGEPTRGLARKKKSKTARADRPVVSLAVTRGIAAHLHVVHQAVLWIMRLMGLRISEVYGIYVGDIVRAGPYAVLFLRRQGGRKFAVVRADGEIGWVDEKEELKTGESYRVIILPPVVVRLVDGLIAAFHTSADGVVDATARLIPGIRQPNLSGQGGFRTALRHALEAEDVGVGGEVEDRICPHDLRKSLSTELAWEPDLHPLALRRMFGHAPGADVHDLYYVLDRPDHEENRKVADRINADATTQLPGGAIVATAKRPSWGRQHPIRARLATVDAVLVGLGWHTGHTEDVTAGDEPLLDTAAVAALLDRPLSTVRTWLDAGVVPARKLPGPNGKLQWYAQLADVEAFQAAEDGKRHVTDIAAELGVGRHDIYAALGRLRLEPPRDRRTGEMLIDDEMHAAVTAEIRRLQQLHARSMPLTEAIAVLGAASVVQAWLSSGRLERDTETDALRRVFVTRASIEALRAQRRGTRAAM